MSNIIHIKTISDIHAALGLDKPKHPLVTVIPIDDRIKNYDYGNATYVLGFYQVSLKAGICGEITYGRNTYDFQEGTMVFTKPGQALSFKASKEDLASEEGWTLLFHPDLIRKSSLGNNIDHYSFFSYEIHEALHLSEDERVSITGLVRKIETEYQQSIDRHTQKLIVSNIELLLDYCTRFYDRQFYVRTNLNQDFVTRFENLLRDYFNSDQPLDLGVPSVKYCGEQLNMSPSYLSDLLKKETGRTAQQHIQDTVIDKAKNLLLSTNEQVSQIAYGLGFDYPQHFSKLFKSRTGMSPAEYRRLN
ncbi:MAG: helix-turn-helix transcriptional regulator [Candidatus Thiodiazotropha taylori]|uniref:Helix-turn-helix transcriptional regulator n=1 Tax=Candidatus Thiodiazotropha taylori TaxID=2792791 RepID=A0A9E4KDL3_9GAMM|nr:helix-turn-helix transcriptional regulator [Candidatus Thiodiazotropha taylori]MCG8089776.1 helix-turn-helix transcriptional regulator [Candidatus Thiodiazotropha taylori]MCW4257728.1 helix-turn-helix transcriptional regulator [Candidatus Thiodiazotropha taylori]MCW4275153.1 helix-turn-helix transcriptional regulator [Candidatus Thiodiazotropha taylori]